MISECSECKDTHWLNVPTNTCEACDVSCTGCTGAGNGNCKVCSTSGLTPYIKHVPSGKCLIQSCGNSENFFTPVSGKLFCDVGPSPAGVDVDACKTCEIVKGYFCTAKDLGGNIDGS